MIRWRRNKNSELEELQKRSYPYIDMYDVNGVAVPTILLDDQKYDRLIVPHKRAARESRGVVVDTNLNILQDGLGHVFVEVVVDFEAGREKFLINAQIHLDFFKNMARSTMLGFGIKNKPEIFLIQLPRPYSINEALDIIERGLGT